MVRASELVNKGKNLKNKNNSGEKGKRESEISLDEIEKKYTSFTEKKSSSPVRKDIERGKEKVLNIEKDLLSHEKNNEQTVKDIEFRRHQITKTDIPFIDNNDEDESEKVYQNARNVLTGSLNLFLEKNKIDIDGIKDVAEEFIKNIQKPQSSLIAKALFYKSASFNLIQHQVDVGILSLKVGIALGITGEKLRQLLIGAMLHDIGIIKIPPEIIEKPEKLTDSEMKEIRKHPDYSKQFILDSLGKDYEWLATIVNREHERLDGSGYPQGLSGSKIGSIPEIVGITDIYEALTHSRPQRKRMTPFDAVKLLINAYKKAFSRDTLKALVSEWSAFPVGSYVRLSSNKVGRVVEISHLSPLKPKIEVLYDSHGNKLEESELIDLNRDTLIFIVAPVFYEDFVN